MTGPVVRPNLLFIMMDQLQASALGCYGNSVVQTPHLDALAASGVLFERYFVQQALCVPSRCSLFTGRYIHAHGHRNNDSMLRRGERHLGSQLRAAGYFTGYAGKNHFLPDDRGEEEFDVWRGSPNVARLRDPRPTAETLTGPPAPTPGNPWPTAFYRGRGTAPAAQDIDARATDAALQFLDQAAGPLPERDEPRPPFALVASFRGPHPPYGAPPEYYGRHRREDVAVPPAPPESIAGKPPWVAAFRRFNRYDEMTPADVQEIVGSYYDYITFLDDLVGRLLTRLDAHGVRQNTLIVFTADHGDSGGQFGYFEKHPFDFYDCLLHVPFLVSWPGVIPAGERRADLMEEVDVVPTVLDYCGAPVPENVQGRSYRGVAQGAEAGPRDAVFAEAHGPQGSVPAGSPYWYRRQAIADLPAPWPGAMVRTDDWKLCWRSSGLHELYDLRRDPHEHTNLAGRPEHKETQDALEQRLLTWLLETSQGAH
jgi:arylsulfatase